MNNILQIILIVSTVLFCIFILIVTRKKKLAYKYTLLWLVFGIATLIFAIFPSVVIEFSKALFIKEPTNALFLIYIFMMIVIIFYISCAFSKLNEKVTKLVQENALLQHKIEKEYNNKEKKDENN